jgi:hypothetical protein
MPLIGQDKYIKNLGDLREFVKQFDGLDDDYDITIDGWWNEVFELNMQADVSYSDKSISVDTNVSLKDKKS